MGKNIRPRVCAAIIRDNSILMVHHRDAQRAYWTLPGGAIEAGETPQEAVVREVKEETGLQAHVSRFLFEQPYLDGTSRCYLLEIEDHQEPAFGYDPEEVHLEPAARLLQGVAWHSLESKKDDVQVAEVIRCLTTGCDDDRSADAPFQLNR